MTAKKEAERIVEEVLKKHYGQPAEHEEYEHQIAKEGIEIGREIEREKVLKAMREIEKRKVDRALLFDELKKKLALGDEK